MTRHHIPPETIQALSTARVLNGIASIKAEIKKIILAAHERGESFFIKGTGANYYIVPMPIAEELFTPQGARRRAETMSSTTYNFGDLMEIINRDHFALLTYQQNKKAALISEELVRKAIGRAYRPPPIATIGEIPEPC